MLLLTHFSRLLDCFFFLPSARYSISNDDELTGRLRWRNISQVILSESKSSPARQNVTINIWITSKPETVTERLTIFIPRLINIDSESLCDVMNKFWFTRKRHIIAPGPASWEFVQSSHFTSHKCEFDKIQSTPLSSDDIPSWQPPSPRRRLEC